MRANLVQGIRAFCSIAFDFAVRDVRYWHSLGLRASYAVSGTDGAYGAALGAEWGAWGCTASGKR
eukprot:1012241-Rhodomonas_salina.4